MLFTEKPDSPGFPYPHAFGRLGAVASYPITGEYSTNPFYYSREVIRSRRSHRRPPTSTQRRIYGPYPLEGFATHQKCVCRWIAHYWHDTLTAQQRIDWATLQNTALASAHPPISWRGSFYSSHGWALFFLFQKAMAIVSQPFTAAVDYTKTVYVPNAPPVWDPFSSIVLSAHVRLSAPWTEIIITRVPVSGCWVTLYTSTPGRQVGPFNWWRMLQIYSLYRGPGQFIWTWGNWHQAFPYARPGQYVTIGARCMKPPYWTPSNIKLFTTIIEP